IPRRSRCSSNVFEPRMRNVWVAPLGSAVTSASWLAMRRMRLTASPEVLAKVRVVDGFSAPGCGFWSTQEAVTLPIPGTLPICAGARAWLYTTLNDWPNVLAVPRTAGERSRNLDGMRPLFGPSAAVATRRPDAKERVTLDRTALLPSTAPAFVAKFTAATAEPVVAITSAMIATTIDGEGLRNVMGNGPPVGSLLGDEHAGAPWSRAGGRDQGPRRRAVQDHGPRAAGGRRWHGLRRPGRSTSCALPVRALGDEAVLRQVAPGDGLSVLRARRAGRSRRARHLSWADAPPRHRPRLQPVRPGRGALARAVPGMWRVEHAGRAAGARAGHRSRASAA